MSSEVERLADFVSSAGRIVVFTGAGVSTESGIPDFRSPGGVWDRFDPNEFTFQNFMGSEAGRRRYWELGRTTFPVIRRAEPNPGHHALVTLWRPRQPRGRLPPPTYNPPPPPGPPPPPPP